ncbi:hypothetical protein [Mucilaginibacter aquatilis]|uniref:Uncharacterized protein n=1 Tax=Mucilaginibacter aquatilis TaxID=1517760 RepID=A0A6I4IDR9_9SPHI|nr:hypothetical protein [Mucilaginibacter aquatilis]MVN91958.1 hypothetical protein [Mucilaginibacter aquatilis]
MKRFDKYFLITIVAIFAVVYSLSYFMFDMIDAGTGYKYGTAIFIISLGIAIYYAFKYYGLKKWEAYTLIVFVTAVTWAGTLSTIQKVNFIYGATFNKRNDVVVPVLSVTKKFTKSSFSYTNVSIAYDNKEVKLQTSRTNYFLLQHKKKIRIVIGKSSDYGYYVTKLYTLPGEESHATVLYLKDWWSRNWFWPLLLGGFILIVVLTVVFGKPQPATPIDEIKVKKPVPFWKAMALIMLIVFGLLLLAYLAVLAYVYLFKGGCQYCGG